MMFEEKIKNLENSPIYAMSLGSKELFHSNFWAWLMRKNPYMINVFFDGTIKSVEKVDDSGSFVINGNKVNPGKLIQREDKNRDITINLSNGVYVIENKIKTLPYKEQLLKYQYSEKNFKMGCYTGLENPKFAESEVTFEIKKKLRTEKFEHKKWHFLNYQDISKKILSIIDKHEFFSDFEESIIKQYCYDISDLNCIISEKLKKDKNSFAFETDKNLAEIGLDDVYKKLEADKIMREIESHIKIKDKTESGFTFKIEKNFSHNMPLLSFKYIYKYTNSDKNVYSIGVQIQDGQFRRYVETKAGALKKANRSRDSMFKYFSNDLRWFDANYEKNKNLKWLYENGVENEHETSMTPKKNKYKDSTKYNNFDDFIHQFYNIKENTDIDKLTKEINDNLRYAKRMLKDAKIFFDEISEE